MGICVLPMAADGPSMIPPSSHTILPLHVVTGSPSALHHSRELVVLRRLHRPLSGWEVASEVAWVAEHCRACGVDYSLLTGALYKLPEVVIRRRGVNRRV